jgi:hypothetical protein
MVLRATGGRPDGSLADVAAVVADSCWESTRPAILESSSVAVFIVPRRRDQPGASDVTITVRPAPDVVPDAVAFVLTGPAGSWWGKLDGTGRCTIRDVPDARYSVRLAPG